ncbi:MAG: pentapeptide repeat-containing protein [Limnospira sp. PMC 1279.21]|uniref:Pentapeptide repeat protein n=2 Tax=Limnospira TaxID=2596745 RepID=A0A9P1KG34_9CYAN|nr:MULTISPECIES: pentapeptide repeat-containing protein [Limnospira]MDC0840405.1 pentapeptide repeat-containing protein [Limnoraphis robusta]MDT9192546.1 pentapeptide repeat-containing protein [Limnospira sp. PMC 1245.20]MDT9197622.1 pentapeptide repeat-containing protein [Limnospira sp. PMC 1042.18]MDT9202856.1 pentapeptide repeat-containing protein [Limnospira sp. PMC 1243.20]MDT9212560.1 pentapeptide repeat-containing protein [Limnospira sp. PMC 1256.20]MDT9217386.1 pentapeptide repeat-con
MPTLNWSEKGMDAEELLLEYQSGNRDFSAILLCEANLSRVNLSQANFTEAVLSVTNFSGANLTGVNLTRAKLNVSKLSGAILQGANLNEAVLNVANLIRADLSQANLVDASLIRAELMRAELSEAIVNGANLTEADLREATLRHADLQQTNLSGANLSEACLILSNLERSNLTRADLTRADLRGVNLRNAELRQAELNGADLRGANLSGANLRWANLSGANLSGANLEATQLSGASLRGANLSGASLLNCSAIHADLTQANLIDCDWTDANLRGSALTGTKLYGLSRFSLIADEITCDWIDLSPNGDGSKIQRFSSQQAHQFFNVESPTVQIRINAPLDPDTHCILASIYRQIIQHYPFIKSPPSIDIGSRRTLLSFRIDDEEQLFLTAYVVILPFADVAKTRECILESLRMLTLENSSQMGVRLSNQVIQFGIDIIKKISRLEDHLLSEKLQEEIDGNHPFFHHPTQTILSNLVGEYLAIHSHPEFGRKFSHIPGLMDLSKITPEKYRQMAMATPDIFTSFVASFDSP